jgi:DNA-binding MarR family transcriptional regulator
MTIGSMANPTLPPEQPCRRLEQRTANNLGKHAALIMKNPEGIDDLIAFRIYNLGRLAARGAGIMLRRELGISRRDWRILAYVGQQPNMSLNELADVADLEPEIASRGVAKLVGSGIIAKRRLPSNKRLLVLSLTNAGQALYEQARKKTKAYNIDLAGCLDDREAACLDMLLKKLAGRATELTRREITEGDADNDHVDSLAVSSTPHGEEPWSLRGVSNHEARF